MKFSRTLLIVLSTGVLGDKVPVRPPQLAAVGDGAAPAVASDAPVEAAGANDPRAPLEFRWEEEAEGTAPHFRSGVGAEHEQGVGGPEHRSVDDAVGMEEEAAFGMMHESWAMSMSMPYADDVAPDAGVDEPIPDINIESQTKNMATSICDGSVAAQEGDTSAMQAACAAEPWDAEAVVDAFEEWLSASYQDQVGTAGHLHDTPDDTKEICSSIEKNRKEIDAAMIVLALETERRLESSPSSHVTGHAIGTEMLSMYDCYCDKSNPTNAGCVGKAMRFGEDVGLAIEQQAEVDLAGDGGARYMQNLVSSLDRQTRHLRGADLAPAVKSKSITTTSEAACPKDRVKPNGSGTGFQFCVNVPGTFSCNIVFDNVNANILGGRSKKDGEHCTAPLVCAAGGTVKIGALAKYCVRLEKKKIKNVWLYMQLRLCIQAVSDIVRAIGVWIPAAESIFNKFNIFAGCYRLAYGSYSVMHRRLEVVMPEHRAPIVGGLVGGVMVRISGHARFRFKLKSCPYDDDKDWYKHESMVEHVTDGAYNVIRNAYSERQFKDKNTCSWMSGPWAQFGINFRLTMDYPWTDIQKKCTGGGWKRIPRACVGMGWAKVCRGAFSVPVPRLCVPVPRIYMKVKELYKYGKEFVVRSKDWIGA